MLENIYEGLNARPKVYSSQECFCEMYPTCVSSKLCEFISSSLMVVIFFLPDKFVVGYALDYNEYFRSNFFLKTISYMDLKHILHLSGT